MSLALAILTAADLFPQNSEFRIGTYLWRVPSNISNEIFDFCQKNRVSEIYIAQNEANFPKNNYSELTENIVAEANRRNIKIFRIIGANYFSIEKMIGDSIKIDEQIEQCIKYNAGVPDSLKLAGINFDFEFGEIKDTARYQAYADCVVRICSKYRGKIQLDFFIANYLLPVKYHGKQVNLYKLVIDEADRTFIQSYKPSAEEMYEYARLFIEYAKKKNKTIIYGAETRCYSNSNEMQRQIQRLQEMNDYSNTGLQIHTLSNWMSVCYSTKEGGCDLKRE